MDPAPDTNGRAAAAYWSAGIGLLTVALVNLGCELSDPFKQGVHSVGKAWMPGAQGIGPYSGKETLGLAAWLGSWLILRAILARRQVREPASFVAFLIVLGAATTLIWTPALHVVVEALRGSG